MVWSSKMESIEDSLGKSVSSSFVSSLAQTVDFEGSILGWKDKLGFEWEMVVLEVLRQKGFYKYVKFRNSKEPFKWKRQKQKGVDIVLKIGCFVFYIECRYQSKPRIYRFAWFDRTVVPRFKGYPQDMYHFNVILTNRPSNFEHVESKLKEKGYFVFDLQTFIVLLKHLENWLKYPQAQLDTWIKRKLMKGENLKEIEQQLTLKSIVNRFYYPDLLKQLKPITTLRNLWKLVKPTVQRQLTRLTSYTNRTKYNNTLVTKQVSKNKTKQYLKLVYAYVEKLLYTAVTSIEPANKRVKFNPELQLS